MIIAQHGLDAAGHLLLAEGHLRKAQELIMELLEKEGAFGIRGEVRWAIVDAGNNTRRALKLLKEEEPCKS